MYNSSNLPLSFKKVWKKTIEKSPSSVLALIVMVGFYFSFIKKLSDQSQSVFFTNSALLMIFFLILFPFAIFIYQYFYYKSYFYNFEDKNAEITKGIIARSSGNIQYDRLQNIYVDQDILDRLFGLYDVHYETAGENSGFYSHIDGLEKENTDKLVAFLIEKSNKNNLSGPSFTSDIPSSTSHLSNNTDMREISSDTYKLSKAIIGIKIITNMAIVTAALLYMFLEIGVEILFNQNSLHLFSIVLLTILLIVIIFIGSYLYSYTWYKNFKFKFSSDKGEIHTKVISQSISYLYYNKIQNINIKQGLLDRLFDLYKISIETAGEKSGKSLILYGYNQQDAQEIKTFLLNKIHQSTVHL